MAGTFDSDAAGVPVISIPDPHVQLLPFDAEHVGNPVETFDPEKAGTKPPINQQLSPLGKLVEQAKNKSSGPTGAGEAGNAHWWNIAKFAMMHPVDFSRGVSKATKAAEESGPEVHPWDEANEPSFHLPRLVTKQGGLAGVGAGAVNAGENVVESLGAPINVQFLGAGLVLAPLRAIPAASVALRSIAAYFAATTTKGAMEQAKTAGATLANPDATTAEKTEAVLNPLASAAMAGLATKGALTSTVPKPVMRPLPSTGSLATDLGYLDMTRTNAIGTWLAGDNPKETLVAAKDAVRSATERSANTAANDVLHDLHKNFDASEIEIARKALVPAVESGMSRATLLEMDRKLQPAIINGTPEVSKAASELSKAVTFAYDNLDALKDAADKHNAITSAIYQHAQDSGIEFPFRENYVLHAQDFEVPDGFEEAVRGSGGIGSGFRKMRTAGDTYADSIANGIAPKTLDSIDLLRGAVRATQGMVNNNLWTDALSALKDPTNGEPVLVPREVVTRPDGTTYMNTPLGYSPVEVGGRPMAVQNGYAGLFDAMTDASKINPTLSKINATGKSLTLAVDTYHLGRLAFYQAASELSRGDVPIPSYKQGLLIGDMPMTAIEEMAAKGELNPADLPRIREDKAIIDMGVNSGLNVGRIADSMHQEWIQHVPILGSVNKFIFQQFQRGAIYDMFVKEFRYQQEARPELSNEQVARNVAKDVNTRLGNLGSQGVFKSRTAQDLARLVFLAPQWNEALIRSEAGAAKQLGEAGVRALKTGRFTPGLLGRVAGTLAVSGFVANQAINMMTRGHPTWENPEEGIGAKLSAWVPDYIGSSKGFFLNPMTLPAEVTHLLMKPYARTGDWRDAINSYVRSRLSTTARPIADVATKKDALGRPITTARTAVDALPVPIAGSAVWNAGKQLVTGKPSETFPGQFQKQAMATFGVRADMAPTSVQRIQALAGDFKREHNIPPAPDTASDYHDYMQALRAGNKEEAASALEDLLKTKTPQQVEKHFRESWSFPFTGSKAHEAQFYRTLTPEQQATYRQSIQERRRLSTEAIQTLRQRFARKPAQP